jgi:hypothetical protein
MSSDMDARMAYERLLRDPDEDRRARMTVAHRAIDAEDCRELIEMLGLLPKGES